MNVKKVINRAWRAKMQVLVWLLIISLIVPMLPPPRAAAAELPIQPTTVTTTTIPFRDVSPTDWYYDAVVKMQEKGIFSGTDANNFSPKGTMTRAMYVTALGRMAGVDVSAYTASSFADVSANSWYAPYIAWAVAQGITDGTGSGSFSPNGTVSREQMATMTLRYFESYEIPYQTSSPVTTQPGDLPRVSPWAADAVLKLWQAGIFSGDNNGNFNPKAQASRAEAATLFMRNVEVVEAWKGQNPTTPTPTPNPTPTPSPTPTPNPTTGGNNSNNGGGTGGGNGNGNGNGSNPGGGSNAYTLTFESNGGSAIAAQSVQPNQVLTNLPAPTKDGFIFQGWFTDSDLTLIFASGSTISGNTTLYAKYTDSIDTAVQSVPSYSVLDVAPDYKIMVQDTTGNLTEAQVKAAMTVIDTSNPDFAGVSVTAGSGGTFTIASATDGGNFVEGHTYELTLKSDDLTFAGQDATTDIYVFSVAKPEALDVLLNPNMVYLRFEDISNMVMNGAGVNSPVIPVMTATVGDSGDSLADAGAASGTFKYTKDPEDPAVQVGNTVAIYTGVRPDQRTVATDGINDGDVAYVQITAVNQDTYSYTRAETDEVLFKPDVLPVDAAADTDGDPNNHSITIEHAAMNYSDSKYEPLGLNELTTVDVGDFIVFYEEGNAGEEVTTSRYARITSIKSEAEMDVITYIDATEEDVQNIFNISQKQAIDGDVLLSEEQIAQLEAQVALQARESGFVDKATDYLADVAMETQAFKAQTFLAGNSRVSVENLTVVPKISTTVKKINGRTSGVSATLQIGADIVVNVSEEADLVIHMTGTFVQEISLDLGIDGETSWKRVTIDMGFFDISFSVPTDYKITANLDAYSYTGMNIKAEIALVEVDKLEEALDDWLNAKTKGLLGDVKDIATEIEAVLAGVQDTDVDAESLKEQYQEMMEQETEWVPLIKQELFKTSVRVAMGVVEVQFSAEFVLSAQVNLTIGADFYYKMAKRYSVSFQVRTFKGTTNTVNLPGDGDYQFTFYVMGTLGLRAGINMEVKAGVGSVELNSIGVSVEPGVYINLWGYFYYQLKNISGVKTTKSMGALYVEIGIYIEAELGYQIGDGAISDGLELLSKEWPLYWIGEPVNVYDFDYPQDEKLGFTMAAAARSLTVPESLLTMKTLDLVESEDDTKAYPASNFDIQVDNKDFKYNPSTQKVEVVNTSRSVSTGNLVITWKKAPLTFSSEPIKRTIPLTWLAREGDYTFQMQPQNGGITQVVAAAYNAPFSVTTPSYSGYTFDGWYTTATGGTKVTLPKLMPAEDRVLYAHWTANNNTPYTVEHYLLDPNTRTSTSPAYTEMLTGTTGTEIRINSDRFKSDGYANGTSSGTLIKGDGSTVVRVEYSPTTRTMTFDLAYAGAPSSAITEPFGKNVANRIPVPSRAGYTFNGWSPEVPTIMPTTNTTYTATWTANTDTPYKVVYLKQNVGSDTYTVADTESYRGTTGEEANLANIEPKSYEGFVRDLDVLGTIQKEQIASNGKTTLKVYYKRNVYKMTIDYADSETMTQTIDVPFGAATLSRLGTPTRQGYTFTGWLPAPPTTMPADHVNFTAQWKLNEYTVSFEGNGSLEDTLDQMLGHGEWVNEPIEPTKSGYVFGGWYSDSSLTHIYDFTTPVTADLTLYAKWLSTYTVSFDSKGGSDVAAQIVNEGEKAIVPTAPTLDGYVFSGWYSDIDLTIAYNFTTAVVTSDLTLYAKWTLYVPTTYTVSFDSQGGSVVEEQVVNEGAVAILPASPTLAGYTFDGWYSDQGLENAYSFSEGVMEDLTLYAKWVLNSYTVGFNSNGGSVVSSQSIDEGEMVTNPEEPTREGYVFSGWYNNTLTTAYDFTTPVTSNFTLYAKWTAIYTVTFESNGGSVVSTQTVQYGGQAEAPSTPTKDGYTFEGWYRDSDLSDIYNFEAIVTSNLNLYAKWMSTSYTVSFDSNGGPDVESQSVNPGDKAKAPAAPRWDGYTFEGWYTDIEGTEAYNFDLSITAPLSLYAKWTTSPWRYVGDTRNRRGSQFKTAFDSHGKPYIAYSSGHVMTYEQGAWIDIIDPLGSVVTLNIAIDSQDNIYIAYGQENGLTLQRYNGSTWEVLSTIEGEVLGGVSLTLDSNGTPYVSYTTGNSPAPLSVVKYEGGNWVSVGNTGLYGDYLNPSILKFDSNNVLYLYDQTPSYNNGGYISKYENGAWSTIKNFDNSTEVLSLAFDPAGIPYVAYNEGTRLKVDKYEGSTWEPVGTTESELGLNKFNQISSFVGIAFDTKGTPYVAYADGLKENRATVIKYEGSWISVGNRGFSEGWAAGLHFAINQEDDMYLAYMDIVENPPQLQQLIVNIMKYDTTTP